MDLTGLLLRAASRRPHVLVVAVPGATEVRLAADAALTRRGWPVATGPADADVLLVAGAPGPELAVVVDAVWEQVPAPRVRIEVAAPAEVDERLDAAPALLADEDHQRSAPAAPGPRHGGSAPVEPGLGHHRAEHDERDGHGGHGEHGGHAGHGGGHHGHGGVVAGLPMAELGPDRDGLTLDRLHVPLGPVLPDWPAGLVVRVTLQGDVIQEASAEVLDGGQAELFAWPSAAARELDGLACFLGVAGWPSAAGRARGLRDALLAGEQVSTEVAGLVRRIRRSRTLRWLVRGIPAGPTDVASLLASRLAALEMSPPTTSPEHHLAAARLGELLVGAELAAARLIVAAVDPDTDRVEAGHG